MCGIQILDLTDPGLTCTISIMLVSVSVDMGFPNGAPPKLGVAFSLTPFNNGECLLRIVLLLVGA